MTCDLMPHNKNHLQKSIASKINIATQAMHKLLFVWCNPTHHSYWQIGRSAIFFFFTLTHWWHFWMKLKNSSAARFEPRTLGIRACCCTTDHQRLTYMMGCNVYFCWQSEKISTNQIILKIELTNQKHLFWLPWENKQQHCKGSKTYFISLNVVWIGRVSKICLVSVILGMEKRVGRSVGTKFAKKTAKLTTKK